MLQKFTLKSDIRSYELCISKVRWLALPIYNFTTGFSNQ
jgi:hypothetical protein